MIDKGMVRVTTTTKAVRVPKSDHRYQAKQKRNELWLTENHGAIEQYTRYFEQNGIWCDEARDKLWTGQVVDG